MTKFEAFKAGIVKRSPEILLTVGLAGMVTAVIFAVKATPKALTLIEESKEELNKEELTPVETVKAAWKPYIPAAIIFAVSTACIIGSHSINIRRNAALAAAYAISDTALKEYTNKTIDIFGDKADKQIKDEIAKDKVEKNQTVFTDAVLTTPGMVRCFDTITGREFWSNMDILKRAECEINNRLRDENYVSLNEFYYEIDLPPVEPWGSNTGWNVDHGYLKLEFSSQLTPEGVPVLVMSYLVAPRYGYYGC